MGDMSGKISVITGGGTGIGLAIAERLAQEGSDVVLVGRRKERLEAAASKISSASGSRATAFSADVADESAVRALFDSLDQVDVLVTCAGGAVFGQIDETPPERWRELFHGRFFGQINCCHYAVPKMPSGSSILLCSGIADRAYVPHYSGGAALCGAVNAMGKNLAVELAPRGIRVNVLSPGLIGDTAIESNLDEAGVERLFSAAIGATPLGRVGDPKNTSDAAHALITNDYITGIVLAVDGGWTAT